MSLFSVNSVSALMNSLIAKVVTPVVEGVTKAEKVYPKMTASSKGEIATHNLGVQTRQVKRAKTRYEAKLLKG